MINNKLIIIKQNNNLFNKQINFNHKYINNIDKMIIKIILIIYLDLLWKAIKINIKLNKAFNNN